MLPSTDCLKLFVASSAAHGVTILPALAVVRLGSRARCSKLFPIGIDLKSGDYFHKALISPRKQVSRRFFTVASPSASCMWT